MYTFDLDLLAPLCSRYRMYIGKVTNAILSSQRYILELAWTG